MHLLGRSRFTGTGEKERKSESAGGRTGIAEDKDEERHKERASYGVLDGR